MWVSVVLILSMFVSRVAPPHLESNEQPSLAIRTNNEAFNALNSYLSGGEDFNRSLDQELATLRPNSQRENVLMACAEREGTVHAQKDETDLKFRGFAQLSFPLLSDTHVAHAVFNYVDDFAPEVFDSLLTATKDEMSQRQRTTLYVQMNIALDGLETDPRCELLRGAGFELGVVEQASELDLALAQDPEIPAGLRPVYFAGWMPPEEHIKSFLRIMEMSWEDVPATDEAEPQVWTREMIEELHAENARSTKDIANALLVDAEGIAAYSCATIDHDHPEAVSQQITFVHRRARGQGLGMLIKQVLYREVKDRFPDARRIVTFNALDNERMLAINEKLGLRPKFRETSWKLVING